MPKNGSSTCLYIEVKAIIVSINGSKGFVHDQGKEHMGSPCLYT